LSGGDQLRVTVANGDRLPCAGVAQGMEVSIAGVSYTITCVGVDLGCFDFILGVDFLRTLGSITWDFDARTLAFQRNGLPVVWHAAPGPGAPRPTTAVTAAAAEQPMLDRLLQHHAAIFEEPQGLPPARPYDHRTHLLPSQDP
jgi:sorbitol-specific phosphotransferase system component IIA